MDGALPWHVPGYMGQVRQVSLPQALPSRGRVLPTLHCQWQQEGEPCCPGLDSQQSLISHLQAWRWGFLLGTTFSCLTDTTALLHIRLILL